MVTSSKTFTYSYVKRYTYYSYQISENTLLNLSDLMMGQDSDCDFLSETF